nr:LysR family transcriptional regulator [Marinomonas ostreistagni]
MRHLRIFLAVCYLKSTVRAAEHTQVSQPAITQAIAKLEKQLGIALFERHAEGMNLSTLGVRFQRRIERTLAWLDDTLIKLSPQLAQAPEQLRKISTTQLIALIAVHDWQSFSAASRALNVAQSSIYRSAKELEKLLQVSLFCKQVSNTSLTSHGQALTQSAKLAFNEVRQGMLDVGAVPSLHIPEIRIGCDTVLQDALLSHAILDFEAQHAPAKLSFEEQAPHHLWQKLASGQLDIVLDDSYQNVPEDTFAIEHVTLPALTFACQTDHPLLSRPTLELDDLNHFEWVVPSHLERFHQTLSELQSNGLIAPRHILHAQSAYLTRTLVLNSDRVTCLYTSQLAQDPALQPLLNVPTSMRSQPTSARLLTRKAWLPTDTQSHFLDTLRATAALHAPV